MKKIFGKKFPAKCLTKISQNFDLPVSKFCFRKYFSSEIFVTGEMIEVATIVHFRGKFYKAALSAPKTLKLN